MTRNETLVRILTAAVLAPLTVWVLVVGGWAWALYVTLAALIAESEFFSIMEARGYHPHRVVALPATALLILVAHLAGAEFAAGILTATILGILVVQLTRPTMGKAIANLSVSVAGVLYVGWLLTHGIYLRQLGHDERIGIFLVVYVLAVTFLNDTGAYFTGRKLGRHPVAPRISPKKTWEGLVGGLLTAAAGGVLSGWVWELAVGPVPYSRTFLAILGFVLGLVGFCGDLVESLLKRDADVKDSGSLLPGHGGLLDRIDGVLFTVPFAYYVFAAVELIREFAH